MVSVVSLTRPLLLMPLPNSILKFVAFILNMSPSANVLLASKAPTNNMLPLELASTINTGYCLCSTICLSWKVNC